DGTQLEGGNLGHRNRTMKGYFPTPPVDKHADLRDDISLLLGQVGLEVERSHHEVGAGGQGEINYKFNTLVRAADDVQLFKYIVKGSAELPVRRPPLCRNLSFEMAVPVCTATNHYGWTVSRYSMTNAATLTYRMSLGGTSVAC